jgi:hypothetical protein
MKMNPHSNALNRVVSLPLRKARDLENAGVKSY